MITQKDSFQEYSFCFEAGHACPNTSGNACAHPHGHSFVLILKRTGQDLQADNDAISAIVEPLIATTFHHKWLNDTLDANNPDLAFIARWLADHLKQKISYLSDITLLTSIKQQIHIKI
ncbi:MAG: 6-carboxytetrahydropterin synthase [Chlamydiales bacterium]|nr:6-carboxytetrahydropterin synthase [Chlamydiales bacterium]